MDFFLGAAAPVSAPEWRRLGVRAGSAPDASLYCDNSITTSKYTMLTFLPRTLFEQFRRTANQYFLLISVLMLIGTYTPLFYSPLTAYSTIAPLVFILGVTAVKEGFEDLKRHQSDSRVNERAVSALATPATSSSSSSTAASSTESLFADVSLRRLAPGTVVLVRDREEIPADMIALVASDGCNAFVETANIDGETNLKTKRTASPTAGASLWNNSADELAKASFELEYEPANGRVHTFEGTLRLSEGTAVALDASQFLLRGSTLRNTKWVVGVVVYTGRDTRLARNARDVPSKLSELESVVNSMVMFVLLSMAFITTVSTIAFCVFTASNKPDFWYMCYRYKQQGVPALLSENCNDGDDYSSASRWFTFFILYNNFIPISLYVTIEIINLVQAFYIDNDLSMYDAESDTPALARTSNMNADLGMISHIFSDKTGTLTKNVMKLVQVSVGGHVYGALDATPPFRLEALAQLVTGGPTATMPAEEDSPASSGNYSQNERDFVAIMAVCHTVVPEQQAEGSLVYQAESPDEEALVSGAAQLGMTCLARRGTTVDVQVRATGGDGGTVLAYEILATIPFDSSRKRMSCVVRTPEGAVRLMTKGADSIIMGLAGAEAYAKIRGGRDSVDAHLNAFACDGLRTLVLAQRELTEREYADWARVWHEAETATGGDRKSQLAAAASLIERDLQLVGCTAIEDKLQDGVPDTIAELAKARIKLWVLTGDKTETAINIGYSCRLLTPDMYIVKMPAENAVKGEDLADYGVGQQLEALERLINDAGGRARLADSQRGPPAVATATTSSVSSSSPSGTVLGDDARKTLPVPLLDDDASHDHQHGHDPSRQEASEAASEATPGSRGVFAIEHLALVIDGRALEVIFGNAVLEQRLLRLSSACQAVIACRVSPAQKRLLVKLVRNSAQRPITLAIGDGANDVGMIQEAQIGVGISGKEGRQAVNNSDFAIAQFRFLKPLLFEHGRRNYRRDSKVIIYSFFKNIVLTFVLFFFQADCAWSGQSFYEDWVYSGYNFFLGVLPFAMGFFDVDVSNKTVNKYPRLFAVGLERMDLNVTNTAYATVEAISCAVLVYYLTKLAFVSPVGVWAASGKVADIWVFGTTVLIGMCLAMMGRALLLVDSVNVVTPLAFLGQCAMLFTFVLFMAQATLYLDYDYFGVAYYMYDTANFWLVAVLLVPAACAALQLLIAALHLEFLPNISDIGKELDQGHLNGRRSDADHEGLLRLRSRFSVHSLVTHLFGSTHEQARATLVTRDSLRDTHATLTREESLKMGIHEDMSSSYAFDHAV